MKWHDWVVSGMLALLTVLVFLPLIMYFEWRDIMDIVQRKKQVSGEAQND